MMAGDQLADYRDNVIVRGSDFWGLLSEGDRKDLIAAARSRTFPSGGILCLQGEPTTHVFILQSGWVKIITVTHDGREALEALRRGGEVVGEMAGHLAGYRTATMQALGTVRALLIGAEQFGDFLDLHPFAGHAYRQAMVEVQQVAYEKQRSHALLSGAQRLAGLLLDLTESGSPAEERSQLNRDADVPPPLLSQEELASLIGTSRSTVTRALQGWRSRRIIGTDPRHVEILDRPRLQRIAGRDSENQLSAGRTPPARGRNSRPPTSSRSTWPETSPGPERPAPEESALLAKANQPAAWPGAAAQGRTVWMTRKRGSCSSGVPAQTCQHPVGLHKQQRGRPSAFDRPVDSARAEARQDKPQQVGVSRAWNPGCRPV